MNRETLQAQSRARIYRIEQAAEEIVGRLLPQGFEPPSGRVLAVAYTKQTLTELILAEAEATNQELRAIFTAALQKEV